MDLSSVLRICLSLFIFGLVHSTINHAELRTNCVAKEHRATKEHRTSRAAPDIKQEPTSRAGRPSQNTAFFTNSNVPNEFNKRGWKDNTVQVGGAKRPRNTAGLSNDRFDKRKWGDNSMQVWGKRNAEGLMKQIEDDGTNDKLASHVNNVKLSSGDQLIGSKLNSADWNKQSQIYHYAPISASVEIKRKWGDNSMSVWGKRNSEEEKRKWGDNSMSVWGKRNSEEEKRKWGDNSMSVWGKRSSEDEKRKWGDNSMLVWGKRSSKDDKRKWGDNSMSVWGKRSGEENPLKDASMAALGVKLDGGIKRNLGDNFMSALEENTFKGETPKLEDNSIQSRGKRSSRDNKQTNVDVSTSQIERMADVKEKRKWGDNSMSVWGKRSGDDEKRKWGDNAMSVWGKRTENDRKRKWGDNSMSVWGKRSEAAFATYPKSSLPKTQKVDNRAIATLTKRSVNAAPSQTVHKRKWGENTMATWGKRDAGVDFNTSTEVKRKWGENTMTVWGKRTPGNDSNVHVNNVTSEGQHLATPRHIHSLSKRSLREDEDNDRAVADNFGKYLAMRGYGQYENRPQRSHKRNWETNTMRVWGKRGWKTGSSFPAWRLQNDVPSRQQAAFVPLWRTPSRGIESSAPLIPAYIFDELADETLTDNGDGYIEESEGDGEMRSQGNTVLVWK